MSSWDQFLARIRSLMQPAGVAEPPPSLRPRVLLIIFDPIIDSEGGRKLSQVLGWGDADELCQGYIADLRECSDGFVEYQIVGRMEVDSWPIKETGFRYDDETFLRNWRSGSGWHQPDWADYEAIIAEFDLLQRVTSGQIDEVWLFGFPYAGFYESRMVGPGSFWCNAPEMDRADVSRRFVIMGFNYERNEVGPMLESFGHRFESIMERVWRHKHGEDNLWKRFIRYEKVAPGQANCGNVHFAPNSEQDYDWGNSTKVLSNCADWLNFPNFQGIVQEVDASEWGGGHIRAHHKWWLRHLPNTSGDTQGISNNWWWYTVDPNAVR
jgi:hypothetical protein